MKTFKPSGVDWLGDIPAHWQVCRLKNILQKKRSAIRVGPFGTQLKDWDFLTEGHPVYTQRNVLDNNFSEFNSFVSEEKFLQMKSFVVEPYDILITTRGTIGKIAVAPPNETSGIIHPCLIKFSTDRQKINDKFLTYLFNETEIISGQFRFMSNETTIAVIYSKSLKNIKLPCPPLDEQKTIAAYLDKACGALDREIETQRALIDKLRVYKKSLIYEVVTGGLNPDVPKKFSGVDWIGDIPAHWQVIKLKFVAKNFVDKKPYVGGVYVGMEHVESWTGKISYPEGDIEVDSVLNSFDERTILFGKLRPYLAKVARPDRVGQCSTEFLTLLPRDGVDKNFLFHTLSAKGFIDVVNSSTYGVKMPRASWQFIGNLLIPLPPLDEQKTIAAYLDRKCRLLDENISERTALVGRLSAYKKSLIYEVVTGKTEVGR